MTPVFLVHCARSSGSGREGLPAGDDRISLQAFRRLLEDLGIVVEIVEIDRETMDGSSGSYGVAEQADAIYDVCAHISRPCLLLSFTTPDRTPLCQRCPTIPIFTWQYADLQAEREIGRPVADWASILAALGNAITHSSVAEELVRKAMGDAYPVSSIPAPVWSRSSPACDSLGRNPDLGRRPLEILAVELEGRGAVEDPAGFRAEASFEIDIPTIEEATKEDTARTKSLELTGVVYAAVFDPRRRSKNSREIVRAFVRSLGECDDATLVVELRGRKSDAYDHLAEVLGELRPFRCRVVVIDRPLTEFALHALAMATTYAVNASSDEGHPLSLMQFMSCGVPAIAPRHAAMSDFVDERNAFLVEGTLDSPPDRDLLFRSPSLRIADGSLTAALTESYRVAREDPERYRELSRHAWGALRQHCSDTVVRQSLIRHLLMWIRSHGYPGFRFGRFGDAWPGRERSRYSQGNEELIVRDFFGDSRNGTFVDVGCAAPNDCSTTCYLEKHLGWSGLGIDAQVQYGAAFEVERPRTVFENFIVTDHEGTVEDFYRVPYAPGLSSTSKVRRVFGRTWTTRRVSVPTTTLNSILERHGITSIDFLSIDVEHSEPKVLAGFDIVRFRPRLVCIEYPGDPDAISQYFAKHGYEQIEKYEPFDRTNRYFRPGVEGRSP